MFTLICESLHAIFPMTSSEAEVKDFINGGKNTCKCKLHKCNFYKISYKNRYYDVQWWYQMVIPWCICYHIHISSNPCGTLRMPWYYRVSCQWTHGTIVYIYVSMMISDVHYIAEMQINVNNVFENNGPSYTFQMYWCNIIGLYMKIIFAQSKDTWNAQLCSSKPIWFSSVERYLSKC